MAFYKRHIVFFLTILLCCGSTLSYSQWIKKGSTGGLSYGESVTVDNSGNVYSAGTFFCSLIFDGDTLLNSTCSDGIPQYDGFVVKYDGNGTLQWAEQIVGEKNKLLTIKGISTDNSGNCYITGSYTGSLTFGSTTINNTSLLDIFVARYLSNGTFDWVKTGFAIEANSFVQANTIKADAAGNTFVAGMYHDTLVFGTDTLFPTLTQEFFLAKFNASGTYQWVISSTGDSAASEASINDLALDAANHLYVTGNFKDTVVVFPGNTIGSIASQTGIFLARFSDPPSLDWVRKENLNNGSSNGISLDKNSKKLFITGQYKGTPTIGSTALTNSGTDFGAFVAKYDTLSTFAWARNALVTTGDSAATGTSIGVDQFGSAYMAGNFGKKNSNSSITSGTITKTGFDQYDGFVAKYDSVGTIKWIQPLGGMWDDEVRDIYAKDSSNIYIAGYFSIHMRVDSMEVMNDTTGGFNSYTAELDVCPYYSADITASGVTTFCQKDSVLLTATAGAGFTYQWQKNKVNIPGATSMTYYASDSAEYRVIISNPAIPCTKYSLPILITVYSLPNVTVSKNDTTVFCTGDNVRLSVPLGNKYQWLESGIILSAADTNFSYTATISGNYSVIARNAKGCRDTSTITIVNVIPYPTATVTPSSRFIICNGDSVTLTSNTAANYKYQWLRNNNVLPNDTLSVYKAKTNGIYKIRISNQLGCSTTSTTADTITVINTPPATITLSGSSTYCSYNSSTLLANTGVGLKYRWERNGAALLAGDTLSSYVPLSSGSYVVKVRNSTGCEATSSAQVITINAQPSAVLTNGGPVSFCIGDSVLLNASAGTGYSYVWQRNGSTISGVNTSSYHAKTNGNYRVLISAPNTCSDTSSIITVTTNPVPTATINALGSTSFCTGDSVTLQANSGTGFTYTWKRDGTTVLGANAVSYKAKLQGNYTVTITNASSCSDESSATPVTVFTTPPAVITPSGATTFCQGDSVILQANTGAGYNYIWRKEGFVITGSNSSSLKVKTTGSYTVQVSLTSTCTNTSGATVVTVKANQKPVITVNGTDISTSFFNTYQWNRNGTPISGATLQIYNAVSNGVYTVTVENNNNCIATADPVTVCVPAPYITTSGSLLKGSAGTAWQWYLEDILINGAISQNYLAQSSGNYKVKVQDNGGCESYSLPVLVCVPAPTITAGSNNVLTASAGLIYQWYLDEVEIPGANTQIYIAETTGSYSVKVEDVNACEAVSLPLTITVTALNQSFGAAGISVYPNPVSDHLTVHFKNNMIGRIKIELMDLTGTILSSKETAKEDFEFESGYPLNTLSSGIYFLRITDPSGSSFIQKITKSNQ